VDGRLRVRENENDGRANEGEDNADRCLPRPGPILAAAPSDSVVWGTLKPPKVFSGSIQSVSCQRQGRSTEKRFPSTVFQGKCLVDSTNMTAYWIAPLDLQSTGLGARGLIKSRSIFPGICGK
jgi:hypothetical protein